MRNEKGNAMLLVILVLSMVVTLGLAMSYRSLQSHQLAVKAVNNQQAYVTAQSVLKAAVSGVEQWDYEQVAGKNTVVYQTDGSSEWLAGEEGLVHGLELGPDLSRVLVMDDGLENYYPIVTYPVSVPCGLLLYSVVL